MDYEEALIAWGRNRLSRGDKDAASRITDVTVDIDFDEGYSCCGGYDSSCYCSLATSPTAEVVVSGRLDGLKVTDRVDAEDFNFSQFIREICEAGGGSISA